MTPELKDWLERSYNLLPISLLKIVHHAYETIPYYCQVSDELGGAL